MPSLEDYLPFWKIACRDLFEYGVDLQQRNLLYLDTLFERGDRFIDHIKAGQPSLLAFDGELVLSGEVLERPVNYALVKIIDRRDAAIDDRRHNKKQATRHKVVRCRAPRRHKSAVPSMDSSESSRPIVIIEPRAGHGPGIGGAALTSQMGMALDAGHPLYFISFTPFPVANQTLADVLAAQATFVEHVRHLHPRAAKPALIGNGQGGWAAAMVSARIPQVAGPLVFNGSPVSYWDAARGVNPMRCLTGLFGGGWGNALLSDLGGGYFDGADLVACLECLDPINTVWKKHYRLHSNVEAERERYLDVERGWGNFSLFTKQEILTLIDELFIGNKLESGSLMTNENAPLDLSAYTGPIVVFSSFDYDSLPSHPTLSWLAGAYGSNDEIKRRGQVIVCLSNEDVAHLGLFVSSSTAEKKRKKITSSFKMLDGLAPGLYRMLIETDPNNRGEHCAEFIEISMASLHEPSAQGDKTTAFERVETLSQFNRSTYELLASPMVKVAAKVTASATRWLHPMRMQRYLLSNYNPVSIPLNSMCAVAKENRIVCEKDNMFLQVEQIMSELVVTYWEACRDLRDAVVENTFDLVYENPWLNAFEASEPPEQIPVRQAEWGNGGYDQALVRVVLAMLKSDHDTHISSFDVARDLLNKLGRLKNVSPQQLKQLIQTQTEILQADTNKAIDTLPDLLSSEAERDELLSVLQHDEFKANRRLNVAGVAIKNRIANTLHS